MREAAAAMASWSFVGFVFFGGLSLGAIGMAAILATRTIIVNVGSARDFKAGPDFGLKGEPALDAPND